MKIYDLWTHSHLWIGVWVGGLVDGWLGGHFMSNLDTYHLDSPPTKRSKRRNVVRSLREPSANRLSAQTMITRGELQRSVSPNYTRKLIGTVIKQEDKKPKVKIEEDFSRNTRRQNRSWPKDAKLVHLDRTPCSEECMKTHPDDDDMPVTVNKSVKDTYGAKNKELQVVPTTEKEIENKSDESATTELKNSKENSKSVCPITMELHGVPDKTPDNHTPILRNGEKTRDNHTENTKSKDVTSTTTNDTTIDGRRVAEEAALQEIENADVSPTSKEPIDLQHDLNADSVTQLNTEILEELSEFSNILNLDDDLLNTDLPIVGVQNKDQTDTDPTVDLEIAMEKAKFLEANPLTVSNTPRPGVPTTRTRIVRGSRTISANSTADNSSRPKTTHRSRLCNNTDTTDNSRETRIRSPKGTVHITNYVLRKPTPEETKKKKFKCDACTLYTGYSQASISAHYSISHPPCYCTVCGKVYSNPNALARHMYSHQENKEFECEDCYQKFTFESKLTAHRMKHRSKPAFKCMFPRCDKEFRRMSELNSHVVTHSGKTYYCTQCDYETNNPRQLRDHKRSHSDELRYKCKYCEERFKYTSGRKRHTDKVH